jgi:hypothetical protein
MGNRDEADQSVGGFHCSSLGHYELSEEFDKKNSDRDISVFLERGLG